MSGLITSSFCFGSVLAGGTLKQGSLDGRGGVLPLGARVFGVEGFGSESFGSEDFFGTEGMVTMISLDFDAEGFGSVPEPEGFGVYFGAGSEGGAFKT